MAFACLSPLNKTTFLKLLPAVKQFMDSITCVLLIFRWR